jgi:hypothetical protein
MKLARALGYLELSKSSYCYESLPRTEDKRIFPLDGELEKALKEMTGYELTLGYCRRRWQGSQFGRRRVRGEAESGDNLAVSKRG